MQVWNVLQAARCKYRMQKVAKNRHLGTIAQLCRAVSSQLRHISTIGKKLLNNNISSTCQNMVIFRPLTAEIRWRVWGTPTNFNGFRVFAALLHGTLVVGVSQTLRRWTEGATYIRQGGHHVGHWPTFLVFFLTSHAVTDTERADWYQMRLTILVVVRVYETDVHIHIHTYIQQHTTLQSLYTCSLKNV